MNLGMPEVIIIAIVILFLFGGKKLPELMHGVGKGIRDFKRGMNGVEEEIKKDVQIDDEKRRRRKQQNQRRLKEKWSKTPNFRK